MKLRILAILTLLTPIVASAHPGHPGHDFEWDFAPIATGVGVIVFVTVVGVAIWNRRRSQKA